MRKRNNEADLKEYFDLNVLRGWCEKRDLALIAEHRLPMLAELIQVDSEGCEVNRIGIYGPDVILGRFQPQNGPADIAPGNLLDHENYRLGVPHLYLRLDEVRGWEMQLLTSVAATRLEDVVIEDITRHYGLEHGSRLELGVVRFVFEVHARCAEGVGAWIQARKKLLEETGGPAVYLKRNGGICGPFLRLAEGRALVIGRTAPGKGEIPGTQGWSDVEQGVDWDLAGLEEEERKHIGFRHVKLRFWEGSWCIEPISLRQWVFVNRVRIRGLVVLKTGDEIGLGSVLFHFQGGPPEDALDGFQRDKIVLPEVFSWHEGHVSSAPAQRNLANTEGER